MKQYIIFFVVAAVLLSFVSHPAEAQPQVVDLGLSVKWANANLGAEVPEEYGDYYAWGETETKEDYNWKTYKWLKRDDDKFTKYNTKSSYGTVDHKTVLDPEDDVAHVKLGGKWRMPTDEEWTELRENCIWTWTSQGGVSGYRVTSKTNGNSIFLPAAGIRETILGFVNTYGIYWSSSLNTDYPNNAWYLEFDPGDVDRDDNIRFDRGSVRPVTE